MKCRCCSADFIAAGDTAYKVRCSGMECHGTKSAAAASNLVLGTAGSEAAAKPGIQKAAGVHDIIYEVCCDGILCRRAATKSALQSSSGIECRRTKSDGSLAAIVRKHRPEYEVRQFFSFVARWTLRNKVPSVHRGTAAKLPWDFVDLRQLANCPTVFIAPKIQPDGLFAGPSPGKTK
jgi:hypothetical protein